MNIKKKEGESVEDDKHPHHLLEAVEGSGFHDWLKNGQHSLGGTTG